MNAHCSNPHPVAHRRDPWRQSHPLLRRVFAAVAGLTLGLAGASWAANIAPVGTAILGVNDDVDSDPGTPHFSAGALAHINDGNAATRVDTWFGGSLEYISYVGVVWRSARFEQIQSLHLRLATFADGGWFGIAGYSPAPGGTLTALDLIEPTVQVSTDGGLSWSTVGHSSNYLTALEGHVIGGGTVNPTAVTAIFTLNPPVTQINGIRIIGENGGYAGPDENGFLGVFELEIEAQPGADADADGMPDAWEQLYGLTVGVNDAEGDLDDDGLTNRQEFDAGTRPDRVDTDGDGLSDGAEMTVHSTDPLVTDTDGDGLGDGAEVNTYHTNPLLPDTDGDGLSDGAEVYTHFTNPLARDTDADTFADGLEVALGTDPANPASYPSNASLTGTGILGVNDAIDSDAGTPRFHAGVGASINDANLTTRVDNWFGDGATDLGQVFSFVGITWPVPLPSHAKSLTLRLATFSDGGWFGVSGSAPGVGGLLSGFLVEPSIQVSMDQGITWTPVAHTSDYLVALDGHSIGGGPNPNPTAATAVFTLTDPITGITGIRIIGENGGNAGWDANGFIGVFELEVTAGLVNDVDNDGMDDGWETQHGLNVGVNDAAEDPDGDDLSNIQEFAANTDPRAADTDGDGLDDGAEVRIHNTSPVLADTDGDGLSDGQEINVTGTNPRAADSDEDGLTDGQEVNVYFSNPNLWDTDGDGFNDGLEVAVGTDPTSAASVPGNVALIGSGIIGTKAALDGAPGVPWASAGVAAHVNDANPLTRVDTWNGGDPSPFSYVGVLWDGPLTRPVTGLELTLAIFFDGGWFGVNGIGPGAGGVLSAVNHLREPTVQVSVDGGTTWTPVSHTSDYLVALDGHPLPAVAFGAPTTVTAVFTLAEPAVGLEAIRLIGSEGGTASGGFLGVFELAVQAAAPNVPQPVTLLNVTAAGAQLQFEFDSQAGVTHVVQYKNSLADADWQIHSTIAGDGTRKPVADPLEGAHRFYRITSQ